MLRRNVLIFHTGALGDFVLSWPLAMALSRLYAQSRVIYVTQSQKGALAERALRLESTDIELGWHQLFSTAPKLPDAARRMLEGAHSVLSFVPRSDETWIQNIKATEARANIIPLEPRPSSDYRGHVTDFWIEQLGPWAGLQASTIAMVKAIQERGILNSAARNRTVVIHPGSGGEHKCWPAQQFLELIERLRADGRQVCVILGEVELEKWPASQIRQFEQAAEVVRPATLVNLFQILSTAAVAVMNDSGPAHLAGICGTPTAVLFGASNPTNWRPLGPAVRIIQGESIETIPVPAVYDTVCSLLGG